MTSLSQPSILAIEGPVCIVIVVHSNNDCYKIYKKYNDCVAMLSLKKTAVAAGVAVIVLLAVYGTLAALGGLVIAILAIYCRHAATPRQKA